MAETDVVAMLASTLSCTYWPTFPDNSRTGLNNSAFAFLGSCDGLSDSRSVSTESVQINTDRRLSATAKDVRSRSNSAVPSTTEHSRSTFSCGRTVTLPSCPEVAEPQNRKLGVEQRPHPNRSIPRMLPGKRRWNVRPNVRLFRKRRAHDHQVLARALCKHRSCSNASSDTAPLVHFR